MRETFPLQAFVDGLYTIVHHIARSHTMCTSFCVGHSHIRQTSNGLVIIDRSIWTQNTTVAM